MLFWGTSVWAPILLEEFQSRSEFDIEQRKTFLFPSKTGSSIPTFGEMHLNSLM